MDGWTDRWTDQQKIIHRGGCHNLNKNVNAEEIIKVFNKQYNNLFEKPCQVNKSNHPSSANSKHKRQSYLKFLSF